MAHLYVFWNEIWPWHIGLRWAIVALWATCLNKWKSELAFYYYHGCFVWYWQKKLDPAIWPKLINLHTWAATWQNQQNGCAPIEDSDQPGHPPSLIRVFAVRTKKAWVFSYPLGTQQRLRSDWADALPNLIWVFAGCTLILLVLSCRGSHRPHYLKKVIEASHGSLCWFHLHDPGGHAMSRLPVQFNWIGKRDIAWPCALLGR